MFGWLEFELVMAALAEDGMMLLDRSESFFDWSLFAQKYRYEILIVSPLTFALAHL